MKPSIYQSLLVMVFAVVLTEGCALLTSESLNAPESEAVSDSSTVSPFEAAAEPPTNTPLPTLTYTPSPLPTPTRTPYITPTYLPPPPLPDPILESFLFSSSPGCQLPCWQGLVPGESDATDVQAMFDDVLGFEGRNIFLDPVGFGTSQPDGYVVVEERWENLSPDIFSISMRFYFDAETMTLRVIQLSWLPINTGAFPQLTIQGVIRELGTPSRMLTMIEYYSLSTTATVMYDQGIIALSALHTTFSREDIDYSTAPPSGIGGLCLNSGIVDDVLLMAPFDSAEVDVRSLQEMNFFPPMESIPVEDAFGVSLQEISRLALQEEDPCIYTDISVFLGG